jgi:hypothetical protein
MPFSTPKAILATALLAITFSDARIPVPRNGLMAVGAGLAVGVPVANGAASMSILTSHIKPP